MLVGSRDARHEPTGSGLAKYVGHRDRDLGACPVGRLRQARDDVIATLLTTAVRGVSTTSDAMTRAEVMTTRSGRSRRKTPANSVRNCERLQSRSTPRSAAGYDQGAMFPILAPFIVTTTGAALSAR